VSFPAELSTRSVAQVASQLIVQLELDECSGVGALVVETIVSEDGESIKDIVKLN
jgi:hypothetical protein